MRIFAFVGGSLALAVVAAASADVTPSVVQVNASASELISAGFDDVGNGLVYLSVQTACGSSGCFTLAGPDMTSGLPNKGFFQFQFLDFNYANYTGLYTVLDIGYGTTGWNRTSMINLINSQTPTTSVLAQLPSQAGNDFSKFDEWLPEDLQGSIILNWQPSPGPTEGGLSQIFTFAWDLTVVPPALQGGDSLTVNAVYGVPAPGALALLGLAGIAGGSRRRR